MWARERMGKEERRRYDLTPTRHHIINKCRRDLFRNILDQENIVKLPRRPHELHHLSEWNNAPHETLKKYRFFTQVMSPRAKDLYEQLLSLNIEDFYKEKYVKWHKKCKK